MSDVELGFQKIHDVFRPKILRYLTRLVGKHEAEDLTQEVFLKVAQGLTAFRGDCHLATWMYRIATNAALDRLRSPSFQQTRQRRLLDDLSEADSEQRDTWKREKAASVEQRLIRKEMNQCIRDFVENLPANYRSVVVLSELEGFKNNEIAEILGVPLHTIKIRLHRARAKLKKELDTHCNFYRDDRNELACDLKAAFRESPPD